MSGGRPLEYVVLFTVAATESQEEGEEGLIVQLAWGVVSIAKNQVMTKEQVYVCPGGGPPRSLPAGVLQDAVQAGVNLDSALKQFHSTLTKLGGSTFSLMTFGHNPLRGVLHPQAYKICLGLQKYLHRYLDMIKEFSKAFPTVTVPDTVEDMAKVMGVAVSDTTKPGVERISLLAQIAQKFISQGRSFQAPEVIKDDIKLETTPNPSLIKEDCVVRLRGLPFQASLKDVAGFLSGLNFIPGGIVFGINSVGRRTGEAIVALETPEQAQLALQRHKHYLNQRYVEVYEAKADDFKSMAVLSETGGGGGAGGGGAPGNSVCVARLQGLPYRATEEEIVEFFSTSVNVKYGNRGVMIVKFPDGKISGDAFACFENEEDLTKALQLNKSMLGTRYVELFKSSQKELEVVLSRSGTDHQRQTFAELLNIELAQQSNTDGFKGQNKDFVLLRGVPYSATPEDVITFFGDLKSSIAHQGVRMVLNAVNRPSGECVVQMQSEAAAEQAGVELHKKYMEHRYIEVFQCSGDEVSRTILSSSNPRPFRDDRRGRGGGGGRGRGGGGYQRREQRGTNCVKVQGIPFNSSEGELCDFFDGYDVEPKDVEIIFNRYGRPAGLAYVTFSDYEVAQKAVDEKDGKHLGPRYLELSIAG